MANEAFVRVKIDQLLKDADWSISDGRGVRFEYPLDDGGKADYSLFDRQGRALAVLEAKSTSVNLSAGEAQGGRYADQLGVPFIFLSNGEKACSREPSCADASWLLVRRSAPSLALSKSTRACSAHVTSAANAAEARSARRPCSASSSARASSTPRSSRTAPKPRWRGRFHDRPDERCERAAHSGETD